MGLLLLALAACGRSDMDLVPVGEESSSSSSSGGSTEGSSGTSSEGSSTTDVTSTTGTSSTTDAETTSSTTDSTSTTTDSTSTTDDPSTSTTDDPSTTTDDPSTTTDSTSTTDDPSTTTDSTSTTDDPSTTTDSTSTTDPPIECGNGILEDGEECDPGSDQIGPDQACVPGCLLNVCGDAMDGPAEECDPGSDQIGPDQACVPGCLLNVCGDAMDGPAEECDDGNADDEDACHTNCLQARATFLALGGNHTCALVDNGSVRCWGNGNNGRTGHGNLVNIGDDEPASAAAVVSLGGPAQQLITGLSHTCVRYGDGTLRCFGRALEGQLGYGNTQSVGDDELPSTVGLVPTGGAVQSVVSRGGSFHSCALRLDGQVRCWGASGMGRLGVPGLAGAVGDNEPADAIASVSVGGVVTQLSTGAEHTCARLDDGSVRCWGSNASGQLGRGVPGNIGDDEDPSSVAPVSIGAAVLSLTTGFFHTCALLEGGAVRCWGRGNNGRLGYGNTAWIGLANAPSDVGDVDVGGVAVQLVAGNAHTCALLVGGTVRCWGWAAQGQLGYGNLQDIGDDELPSAAGDVDVGAAVVQIAADGNHTCALLESGQVRCWGNGGEGRLGYGNLVTVGDDETPAMVGDVPLFP
jgi:alpha-tubulin suppressor-like RCC1 family protein